MLKSGTFLLLLVATTAPSAAQPGATPPGEASAPSEAQPPDDGYPAEGDASQLAPDSIPRAPVQAPPPGSTQATFVSTTSRGWEVLVDGQPACATPCSIFVPPLRFVTLRSFERSPVLLEVGRLPAGSVVVEGTPLQHGKYAAGITFTTLSGMALITGVTLTAIGCTTDREGMCTAGLITGGVGAVGLYASIQLMRSAVPRLRVLPGQPYVSGSTVGYAGSF